MRSCFRDDAAYMLRLIVSNACDNEYDRMCPSSECLPSGQPSLRIRLARHKWCALCALASEALKENTSLKEIDLQRNQIKAAGKIALLEANEQMPT